MTDIALVRVTCANQAEAERIAEIAVRDRLAACATIEAPCRSVYRWDDRVERASEVPILFKTSVALAQRLADMIADLHSYDLPAIEMWPAAVSPALAQWVDAETGA
ncbi:divalent-cation tolerance protein CutA [Sphingomonas aestuarii]